MAASVERIGATLLRLASRASTTSAKRAVAVVAKAFLSSRLGGGTADQIVGVLPAGIGTHALAHRITPGPGREHQTRTHRAAEPDTRGS